MTTMMTTDYRYTASGLDNVILKGIAGPHR